jgi:hypothetical protein
MECLAIGFCNIVVAFRADGKIIRWPYNKTFVGLFPTCSALISFVAGAAPFEQMDIFVYETFIDQKGFVSQFRRNCGG